MFYFPEKDLFQVKTNLWFEKNHEEQEKNYFTSPISFIAY